MAIGGDRLRLAVGMGLPPPAQARFDRGQLQRPQRPMRSARTQSGHQGRGSEEITGAQTWHRECLCDAADHDDVIEPCGGQTLRLPHGHVRERLVDDDDAAGTAQGVDRGARMQDRGGIGGVTEHHHVHIVGNIGVGEVPRLGQHDVVYHDTCGTQHPFGFGERRLDQSNSAGSQIRKQREPLGGAGEQQDLLWRAPVHLPDRGQRGPVVGQGWIPDEVLDSRVEGREQPRRDVTADVDREIDHPRGDIGVAVPIDRSQNLRRVARINHSERHNRPAYGDNGGVLSATDPADPSTLLLFDLDGTITDSFDGIANSFRHALNTIGHPDPDPVVVAGIAGPPMIDTLCRLGLDGTAVDAAMAAYRTRYNDDGWSENAVFPGMAAVLDDLRALGRRMAVTTSKNQGTARRILAHFGLDDHFEYIAGASEDGSRRTKRDVVAHALAELGVDASERPTDGVVIVGDRSHDIHGAGEFGIPAVLVGWGYALDGESDDARWVVGTVDELREVLGV